MEIVFDKHWKQRDIKNIVKDNCFLEFGKHENLKALCINISDEFDVEDKESPDYIEMIFIVPEGWLRSTCREEFNVNDLDYFLQEEYTNDESIPIFTKALNERKVVCVDF